MNAQVQLKWEERRSEVRYSATAPALLLAGGPAPRVIRGSLVDRSDHGFRFKHDDPDLKAGEKVTFTVEGRSGEALVVWRRIADRSIECGLMIV